MGWFLSPLAWMLIAGALVAIAWLRPRPPHGWAWAGGLLAACALAVMTPLGSNWLVRPLERWVVASPGCTQAPPSTALVLGGGVDGWPRSSADFSALNLPSRRRMDRAVAWWRERPGRVLVLQGGAPHPRAIPLATLMAAYAQARGVPAQAVRVEARSGDTWENAVQAAALSPRLPSRIVLVTSLVHMPRAQRAFTHAGFEVCPVGADARRLPSRLPWALVPRTSALVNAEDALHEWAGLVYYRWRARSPSAAPGH